MFFQIAQGALAFAPQSRGQPALPFVIVVAADEITVVTVVLKVDVRVVVGSSEEEEAGLLDVAGGEDGGVLAGDAGCENDEDAGGLATKAGPVELETCAYSGCENAKAKIASLVACGMLKTKDILHWDCKGEVGGQRRTKTSFLPLGSKSRFMDEDNGRTIKVRMSAIINGKGAAKDSV